MTIKNTLNYLLFVVILMQFSNIGFINATNALYTFGDSFLTAGNGGYMGKPWGMTWPGYPTGRVSDGRIGIDYLAELLGVPSPIASMQLKNDSESLLGVNFAYAGAGITYAFGYTSLDTQMNDLESFVNKKVLTKHHLRKSVAFISLGVNDYSAYNTENNFVFKETATSNQTKTMAISIVDGIAFSLVRLHSFGFRNIVIANLPSMICSPYITVASNYSSCSANTTLTYETSIHDEFLQQRINLLNKQLRGANFLIVNQTKAFDHIYQNGSQYGFENPLTPCCTAKDNLYDFNACGTIDDNTNEPLYKMCEHPEKAVVMDGIHPTQAAWKTVFNLYASIPGYTQGLTLKEWIQKFRN